MAFSNTFKCLLQAENNMTGRVYMGEVLIEARLKSIKLFDKQVNAQKESLKNTPGVHKKVCNEQTNRKK